MPVRRIELIEAQEAEPFYTELTEFLDTLEFPQVDLASIRVSLALAPGPLYAATVTWLDIEDDLLNTPVLGERPLAQS